MDVRSSIFDRFVCVGKECKRNCCQGWNVSIDKDTADYYRSLEDDFGKKIQSKLEDREGGFIGFVLDHNEKCPAQREDGFCDIFIRYGEDKLSEVCTSFPRLVASMQNGGSKFHFLFNDCEEVVRILNYAEEKLDIIIEAEDEEDIASNSVMFDLAQLTAWVCDFVQDESISLWNSLTTVIHIVTGYIEPFVNGDVNECERVLNSIPDVSTSYANALAEISDDELTNQVWEQVMRIVVAYLDAEEAANYDIYRDLFVDKDKFNLHEENRGSQLTDAFFDYVRKMNGRYERLFRRLFSNLYLSYSFSILDDNAVDNFLYKYAPQVIITYVVPALWEDEAVGNVDEFSSRLSIIKRTCSNSFLDKFSAIIKEQMSPDIVTYALMFACIFGR